MAPDVKSHISTCVSHLLHWQYLHSSFTCLFCFILAPKWNMHTVWRGGLMIRKSLTTLCKNKLHGGNIIRHLNLSGLGHGDNDPAKQFTQGTPSPCTGLQRRDLWRSSTEACPKAVGTGTTRIPGSLTSALVPLLWGDSGSSCWISGTVRLPHSHQAHRPADFTQFALVKSSLFLRTCLNWRLNQECCHDANEQQAPVDHRRFQRKTCKLQKVPPNHLTADRLRGF